MSVAAVVEPFAASVSIGFVFPCESCKKPIDIANETDVYCYKGAYTHWGCLKCSRCLRSLGSDFLVKEEKLVCTHCDRTFFDECAHCRRALTTQHVTEHGRMWHPDCFIAYTLTLLPPGEALPKVRRNRRTCKVGAQMCDDLFRSRSSRRIRTARSTRTITWSTTLTMG